VHNQKILVYRLRNEQQNKEHIWNFMATLGALELWQVARFVIRAAKQVPHFLHLLLSVQPSPFVSVRTRLATMMRMTILVKEACITVELAVVVAPWAAFIDILAVINDLRARHHPTSRRIYPKLRKSRQLRRHKITKLVEPCHQGRRRRTIRN
jgi:hypothetical protein